MEHLDAKVLPIELAYANPEEALQLYCQDHVSAIIFISPEHLSLTSFQLVSPTMTLMNVRTHLWRSGGDVILTYKPKWDTQDSNG